MKRSKKQDSEDDQLSLFDSIEVEYQSNIDDNITENIHNVPNSKSIQKSKFKAKSEPRWEFQYEPFTDYIADSEKIVAIAYDIQKLEEISGYYAWPVYIKLFQAFDFLANHNKKTLRNQSFTVYAGDVVSYDRFVLCIGSTNVQLVEHVLFFLKQVNARNYVDAGTSDDFIPVFRYDKGYIIEYSDPESAGETYTDTKDNYSTNLTIYRRQYIPSFIINSKRSIYGKLIEDLDNQ
jgi:hypothetical protein